MNRDRAISIDSPPSGLKPGLGGTGIINPEPTQTTTDLSQCDCNLPTLAIGEGEVGPFEEQVLYCSECGHRFCSIIPPLETDGEENGEDS